MCVCVCVCVCVCFFPYMFYIMIICLDYMLKVTTTKIWIITPYDTYFFLKEIIALAPIYASV